MQYKVTYENETTADDPLQAAKDICFMLNSDPNCGRVFIVEELGTGKKFSVDLDEEEGDEVLEEKQ